MRRAVARPTAARGASNASAEGGGPPEGAVRAPLASITTRVRERSYRVVGSDAPTLRRSIELLGPSAPDGAKAAGGCAAYTRWEVRWSYAPRERQRAFSTDDVRVECDATTTLPRWDPPPRAERQLVSLWQEVMLELRAHEEGHAAIGMAAAREVHDAVARTPACPSAKALRALVERRVSAVIAKHRREELRYDERSTAERSADSAIARLGSLGRCDGGDRDGAGGQLVARRDSRDG